MAPNPLAVWAADHGFDPMDSDQQTELAWALLAAVMELEHKLEDCRLEMDLMARMDSNE